MAQATSKTGHNGAMQDREENTCKPQDLGKLLSSELSKLHMHHVNDTDRQYRQVNEVVFEYWSEDGVKFPFAF